MLIHEDSKPLKMSEGWKSDRKVGIIAQVYTNKYCPYVYFLLFVIKVELEIV